MEVFGYCWDPVLYNVFIAFARGLLTSLVCFCYKYCFCSFSYFIAVSCKLFLSQSITFSFCASSSFHPSRGEEEGERDRVASVGTLN